MNHSSHDDNLIEVIELEKFNNGEVRIGPEVSVDSVEEIKIHNNNIREAFKKNAKTYENSIS